jgi:hypothetical protein
LLSGFNKIEQDDGQVIVEESKIIGGPTGNMLGKQTLSATNEEAVQSARFRASILSRSFEEEEDLTEEQEQEIDDLIAASFGEKYVDSKLGLDRG